MNVPARSEALVGTVDLRIPSEPEWVAVARLAVSAIANRLPFSVEEIEDVKLAVAEACTTCIQDSPGEHFIDITCDVAERSLRIRVRDHAFERSEAARPRAVAFSEGLGVFIIQALMDDVEYNVDPKSGTELVMTKRVGS